jgi:circadian clock protein KaiC
MAIGTESQSQTIPKILSGIVGLDQVLQGGLPKGRVTQVSGGPGSGKTIFGLEFLLQGAREEEPGLMLTFEEDAVSVRRNALSLGWDLAELEKEGKLFILDAAPDPDFLTSGNFDLKGLIALLGSQARSMGAQRLVIDAVDGLLRVFTSRREEMNQLQGLLSWLSASDLSVVLTTKTGENNDLQYEFLDFLCDCVIRLDQRVRGQVMTRRLRVVKYRGSGFGGNEYPYTIGEGGISLLPVTMLALNHAPLGEYIGSGSKALDSLLGGGFRKASCVLITGVSGTGKTTLASAFVEEAARRGERSLYIDFEESEAALVSAMLSPGIDLRHALQEGKMRTLTVMPEAMGAEEHLVQALREIGDLSPQNVVVDAISATSRMGNDQAAFEYLVRLVNFCKERSITVVLTNQASMNDLKPDVTGLGFSSLVDAIILLQYARAESEMKRTLVVWKSRGSAHSGRFHEYRITGEGIVIESLPSAVHQVQNRPPGGAFNQESVGQ